MIDDQARALLIVGAMIASASGSAGFVGGRATAPVPEPLPAEVRFVHVPVPVLQMPAAVEVAPTEPPAAELAAPVAPVETLPLPQARPNVEAKPKAESKPKPASKPEAPKKPRATRALPSCAFVKSEYDRMAWSQRMAAYQRATPEQIAHGKRCLGM